MTGADQRPLVRCDFGIRGIPLEPIGASLFLGFCATVFFAGVTGTGRLLREPSGIVAAGVAWAGVSIVSFFSIAGRAMLEARSVRMSVDDGGIRWADGGTGSYWSFDLLGRCGLERQHHGGPSLVVLDRTGRKALSCAVFGSAAKREALAAADAVGQRVSAGRPVPERLIPLARRGQLIQAWAQSLDRIAAELDRGSGYRSVALDGDTVRAAFEDLALPADVRAAAAYVLIASSDDGDAELVKQAVGPASAPIVVRMVHIAGLELPAAVVREASRFLDAPDLEPLKS